jgi:endonuclease/exonuclease/phosphatase family metal-dependent hydrolase
MATGETIEYLQSLGFSDGDDRHRPTWPSRLPSFTLDYIMTNRHLKVCEFRVGDKTLASVSDHLPIDALILT